MQMSPKKGKNNGLVESSVNTAISKFFGGVENIMTIDLDFGRLDCEAVKVAIKEFVEKRTKVIDSFGAVLSSKSGAGLDLSPSSLTVPARLNRSNELIGCPKSPIKYCDSQFKDRIGIDNAFFLVEYYGRNLGLYCWEGDGFSRDYTITVFFGDKEKFNLFRDEFTKFRKDNSIYKGHPVRIDRSGRHFSQAVLRERSDRRHTLDDVILPGELKKDISDNVLDYIRHSELISKNGFELRRGVLFHGVPGTGKTMMCEAIASELKDFFCIFLAGESLSEISSAFNLAKFYAPSMIVIEDVDLIGKERDLNNFTPLLGELFNSLDNLANNDKVCVIFTTNRLKAIETALSDRPGRIDVIVEFPLPVPELRLKLMKLYSRFSNTELGVFSKMVEETEGCTPAFIKELVKRAVLMAIREGSMNNESKTVLLERHLANSLRELKEIKNSSAKKIIGFMI